MKNRTDEEQERAGVLLEHDPPIVSSAGTADHCQKKPYYKIPTTSPSPFEVAMWNAPSIVLIILGCLGDPSAVCRMKAVNRFCKRIVVENEYFAMKDAVRLGGIPDHIRPAFWLWITLEKCQALEDVNASRYKEIDVLNDSNTRQLSYFNYLEQKGRASKWHHVIERDVMRAFGNLPPHKAKSTERNSIVRALMSWGQNHFLRRDVDGSCRIVPSSNPSGCGEAIRRLTMSPPNKSRGVASKDSEDEGNFQSSDTVSDWGGISPVGSNISSVGSLARTNSLDAVLGGNELTQDVKIELQKKLETILNVIAAVHEGLGYCQGMDYIVAHLLRVLQETIEWVVPKDKLLSCVHSVLVWKENKKIPLHETEIVEETVFLVMHTLLSTYQLRHMYWPELRALKTCCRVFERLIHKKLPVLADHFDHHDLNIGLFALGWFQTCFLYIPSMPSKTINRIWDIWLVERSPKIFFRVATAILFLSQPILLNNDLEGMMQYLNTFPDATIFNADILINCALQIKITNRMLTNLEVIVMRESEFAMDFELM
eukprot:CAMPEP_0176497732 /NCGR_PEP_ID=MMETSP0200_2-20121128/11892_1 /TAXON_ID=947934 /ORGANISM="Chaetoceros sp., Strain GSL56" /LENGTH=540 /DNA_ID=CAMNT_0017895787 /DNA_START=354 /DNA_END=1977 /DNA_ORIENTATION=-